MQAESRQELIQLDNEFHLTLARATGNAVLSSVVERLNDILSQTRLEAHQGGARTVKSLEGHSRIVQAIAQGDSAQANRAMRDHLKVIKDLVLSGELGEE